MAWLVSPLFALTQAWFLYSYTFTVVPDGNDCFSSGAGQVVLSALSMVAVVAMAIVLA